MNVIELELDELENAHKPQGTNKQEIQIYLSLLYGDAYILPMPRNAPN
jgi:hypothetical protein